MDDVKEINGIVWERTTDDYITAYKNEKVLGYISQNENSEWEDIMKGIDPIEEGWEDGVGNVVSLDGWGEVE